MVVKSATLPQDAGALNRYNHALTHVGNALATVHNPHVWPTSPKRGIYRTDRSIHLVRQYFSASIASRISTRPFLTDAEKKWLGWQLLKAVAQMHDVGICHGDIKAENVLLTSWGWLMLADFAPYKPVMLPSDNPVSPYSFIMLFYKIAIIVWFSFFYIFLMVFYVTKTSSVSSKTVFALLC